jgi:pilus assembly protein CpaE
MLRIVIVDSDTDSRAALRRVLGATPSVVVVGEYSEPDRALLEAPERRPDILILEVPAQLGRDGAPGLVEQVAKTLPETALVVTGGDVSGELVLRVLRAGAMEYLGRPVDRADLEAALEKVSRVRRTAAPARRMGRTVSVYSPKGGVGVTTVAINLAVCLAERSDRTLLMELDTRNSDLATFLDLRPTYSVLDAFENIERLDESFLRGILVRHASGLWVLPGPQRMERTPIQAEWVRAGLEIVRSHFDHIVLDLRHDMDPGTIAALEASDLILFLTTLNVSALRSGNAALAAFRHLGIDLQRVKVVVMREDTGEDVTVKHARETLGLPVYWKTPSDYPEVIASINGGRPVVTASPKSKIAKNLRTLAELIAEGGTPAKSAPRRAASLLGRMVWTPKGLPGAS